MPHGQLEWPSELGFKELGADIHPLEGTKSEGQRISKFLNIILKFLSIIFDVVQTPYVAFFQ